MKELNICNRRFTIFLILAFTALVAILAATDLAGVALSLIIFVALPIAVFAIVTHSVYRLQMLAANRFVPVFYSRGMFWLIRLACGREYSAWALNNYATGILKKSQYNAANDAFTRLICLDDKSADFYANRGASRYFLGKYLDAIDDLSTALDIENSHQFGLAYRGYSLIAIKEFPAALNDLNQIECDTTDHYVTAYYRGYLHELVHHWKCAFDDYLLAYNLDSTLTDAGISLARLQAGCPDGNLRDAKKAVENATSMCVRTNWDDWVAVGVLGAAYSAAGDFDIALKYARMALDLAPDHEKTQHNELIAQFENHQPFRLPPTDPNTGRQRD